MYRITSYEYIDNNKDRTILFLHGWGCNKKYMRPLAYNIKNCNCLLIDLPGFKENKLFKSPKSFEEIAQIILNFICENNYHIDYIVGHSFGGKLAVYLSNQTKLKHMFLIAASIYNKKRHLIYYIKIITYKLIKQFKFMKKYLNKFGSNDYKTLSPVMKRTMSNVINYKMTSCLKESKTPTTLIYGTKDKTTPLYIAYKANKHLTDSNIIKIKGAHFAYLHNITFLISIIESVVKLNG